MAKKNVDKKDYETFISDVAALIIKQVEDEDKTEDLVGNTVDIVKSDPLFRSKILAYIFSKTDLKKELKDKLIDDMCD